MRTMAAGHSSVMARPPYLDQGLVDNEWTKIYANILLQVPLSFKPSPYISTKHTVS